MIAGNISCIYLLLHYRILTRSAERLRSILRNVPHCWANQKSPNWRFVHQMMYLSFLLLLHCSLPLSLQLGALLQTALLIEVTTIPAYLYAMYSIKDNTNEGVAARRIFSLSSLSIPFIVVRNHQVYRAWRDASRQSSIKYNDLDPSYPHLL